MTMLVGHIGKLVKLGIGMTNTHSSYGDGRMETLAVCALKAGADLPLLRGIMDCVATDAALALIDEAGLLRASMDELGGRIGDTLRRRAPEGAEIGFVCFTNGEGIAGVLAESDNAQELMNIWREQT